MRIPVAARLTLAAELGHLGAAWAEAPGWPLISAFHIVIAAGWGLIFAGLRRPEPRPRTIRWAGALAVGLPVLWVLTRTFGLPTYLTLTRLEVEPVGVTVTLIEVALAVALWSGRSRRSGLGRPAPPAPSERLAR